MTGNAQKQKPHIAGLYLWGDLLGEGTSARFFRPRLQGLLQTIPNIEARRFWPRPEDEPNDGLPIPLSGGRPGWAVRSRISPEEKALLQALVGHPVPLGSPVLAVASMDQDPCAKIHSDIPQAGPIYLVDPANFPHDGQALATQILNLENDGGHPSFALSLVVTSPHDPHDERAMELIQEALRFQEAMGAKAFLKKDPKPSLNPRVDLHFETASEFHPRAGAALSILRLPNPKPPFSPQELQALRAADQLWVPSGFGRRILENMGVPPAKIHCVPPPLTSSHFRDSGGKGWDEGDTHPLELIEAMAQGLPVWVSPYGLTQDLVEHQGNANLIPGRCIQAEPGLTEWLSPTGPGLETATPVQAIRYARSRFAPERICRQTNAAILEGLGPLPAKGHQPGNKHQRPLLRLEGPIFESSSYGRITRSFTRALRQLRPDLPIELHSRMDALSDPNWDADLLPLCIPSGRRPTHTLRSGWPVSHRVPDHGKWLLRFDWEFGPPPLSLAGLFSGPIGSPHAPDQIWVHSQYVRDNLLAAGIPPERLHLVPHGIDPACFFPGEHSAPNTKTTFLFVGGFTKRKGLDLLLQAWKTAFAPSDAVRLLLKASPTSAYSDDPCAHQAKAATHDPSLAEVTILYDDLDDPQMANLYRSADILVHPYRGEGFGMPILEAMACGLPVITTAGGASQDFVEELGSITISAERVPCRIQEPCAGTPFWLEPKLEELTAALILAAQGLPTLRSEALEISQRVRSTRSWATVAKQSLPLLGFSAPQPPNPQPEATTRLQIETAILPGKRSVT